ncbi:hypothetical protein GCM10007315_10000 [Gemmobacter tilapiae]|uniref:Uncharacterized protein n=1 Tax=Neogemmobacter tilapiae TaxID=875041 RepID=A0A918TK79_9RHOB|nr:hypothetical protein GCM10007315_10000 [Gemmobacter tilapiae]
MVTAMERNTSDNEGRSFWRRQPWVGVDIKNLRMICNCINDAGGVLVKPGDGAESTRHMPKYWAYAAHWAKIVQSPFRGMASGA